MKMVLLPIDEEMLSTHGDIFDLCDIDKRHLRYYAICEDDDEYDEEL